MKYLTLLFLFFPTTLVLGQENFTVADSLLLGRYALAAQGEDFQLQPEAAKAFTAMRKAALNDSIRINVVSSFRSYSSQKRIWNRKYKRFVASGMSPAAAIEKIIEYSTLPGTSRHHWGTDIDLVLGNIEVEGDILSEAHFHDGGAFEKLRLWLEKNAATYGFVLVYTRDNSRKGFFYEPWHYSYAPLSKAYLKQYRERNLLQKMAQDTTILGHQYLSKSFMEKYYNANVLGINPTLK